MALLQPKEVGDVRCNMRKVSVLDGQLSRSRFRHFHGGFCSFSPPLRLVKENIHITFHTLMTNLNKGSARLVKLWLNKQFLGSGSFFHTPSKDFLLHPGTELKLCLDYMWVKLKGFILIAGFIHSFTCMRKAD